MQVEREMCVILTPYWGIFSRPRVTYAKCFNTDVLEIVNERIFILSFRRDCVLHLRRVGDERTAANNQSIKWYQYISLLCILLIFIKHKPGPNTSRQSLLDICNDLWGDRVTDKGGGIENPITLSFKAPLNYL